MTGLFILRNPGLHAFPHRVYHQCSQLRILDTSGQYQRPTSVDIITKTRGIATAISQYRLNLSELCVEHRLGGCTVSAP